MAIDLDGDWQVAARLKTAVALARASGLSLYVQCSVGSWVISYDEVADSVIARLSGSEPDSITINDDQLIVDIDKNGNHVGYEIEAVRETFGRYPSLPPLFVDPIKALLSIAAS